MISFSRARSADPLRVGFCFSAICQVAVKTLCSAGVKIGVFVFGQIF